MLVKELIINFNDQSDATPLPNYNLANLSDPGTQEVEEQHLI